MRSDRSLAALGAAVAAGIGSLVWVLWKSRRDPHERERKRRSLVGREGRIGDGYITDVSEETVFYTYTVHGVEYAASQDITRVRNLLPENLDTVIGPVSLKFLASSPENSIVVSEDWFGIRSKKRRPVQKGA
jgi:hypothetical protein